MTKLHALFVVFLIAFSANALNAGQFEHLAFGAFNGQVVPEYENHKSVVFVGDVMLARKVEYLMDRNGSSYPFLRLDPFRSDAYVVGNFESAMATPHTETPFYTFSFSTDPKHLSALTDAGFTHVSLANNHTYDKGAAGYEFASSTLNSAKIQTFGHPRRVDENSVTFLELRKAKIALIGLHTVAGEPDDADLEKVFTYAKQHSDIQIAYVHWGTEYVPMHSRFQERFAEKLVRHGADLVVGHHPHVVQDIGLIDGVPIFYSLGNFIFDQYFSSAVQEGLMLELVPNEESVLVALKPITSLDMQTVPRPMDNRESKVFLRQLSQRSNPELTQMIQEGVISFTLAKD